MSKPAHSQFRKNRLNNVDSKDDLNVAARKVSRRRSSLRAIPIGKLVHQASVWCLPVCFSFASDASQPRQRRCQDWVFDDLDMAAMTALPQKRDTHGRFHCVQLGKRSAALSLSQAATRDRAKTFRIREASRTASRTFCSGQERGTEYISEPNPYPVASLYEQGSRFFWRNKETIDVAFHHNSDEGLITISTRSLERAYNYPAIFVDATKIPVPKSEAVSRVYLCWLSLFVPCSMWLVVGRARSNICAC